MCQDEDGPRSNEVFVTDYTLLCSSKGVICGGLDKNGDPIAECQGFKGYVRSLPIPHKRLYLLWNYPVVHTRISNVSSTQSEGVSALKVPTGTSALVNTRML